MRSHILDAINRNLPPCARCKAGRSDPCRTPGYHTCKPHACREDAAYKERISRAHADIIAAPSRGAKPADGGPSFASGAAVDATASVPVAALDEVDTRGPALVDGDHTDGFLFQISRDRAGGALGLRVEVPAASGGGGGDQVDDDGGLAMTLPEASRLDVGRGREPDGDVLLHPARELRRVDGDGSACGRERPEAAADQQRRPAGGHEGPEGSSGATAASAGHAPSLPDARAELQERAGRWPNRHWIYVEPQPDGRWLIDTTWVPGDLVLPEVSERLPDGGLRFYVPPDELRVSRLLATLGCAFLTANGEIDPPESVGGTG